MVKRTILSALLTILSVLLFLTAGCAPALNLERRNDFVPIAGERVIYVAPFLAVMTPVEIEEGIFDRFVDTLNEQGAASGYEFVILKQGTERVEREWLQQQHYITGEIFGYLEDSGCCSTAIRINSRIRLYQPENDTAVLRIDYPRQIFFEHDLSTLENERSKLAEEIGHHLAAGLLQTIASP